jgi:hypothetical protein
LFSQDEWILGRPENVGYLNFKKNNLTLKNSSRNKHNVGIKEGEGTNLNQVKKKNNLIQANLLIKVTAVAAILIIQ